MTGGSDQQYSVWQEAGGDQEQGGALLGPEVTRRRDPECGGGAGQQNTGGAALAVLW